MKQSKLIYLLSSFSSGEMEAFGTFLQSPYFNTREELTRLFDYLKRHAPDFPEEALQKEHVFEAAFPGQPFDEKQLAYRMNYLLDLGERFLSIQAFEQSPLQPPFYLMESLIDRKLDKAYQFVYKKLSKQVEEAEISDSDGFFHLFRLGEIGDRHFMIKDERRYDFSLELASDNLDRYYVARKLRMLAEMVNRQRIFNQTYNNEFQRIFLKGIEGSDMLRFPLIKIYYHTLKMLGDGEGVNEQYKTVKRLFIEEYFPTLSQSDRENILSHLLNFCIRQIREQSDRRPFMEEALSLYTFGIESKIYLPKGKLSPWHYKNIIKLAFNLGNFDWAEAFLYQYSPALEESSRDNALYFNLADLYYQKKDYEKAMKFLHQVEFTDIHYQLNAKLLLLKIYYEIDEEEALLSLLASFSILLKRNKYISNDLRKTYENFCKLLTRLLRRNPKKWPRLKSDIQNISPLTDRKWLMTAYEKMAGRRA